MKILKINTMAKRKKLLSSLKILITVGRRFNKESQNYKT